MSTPSGEDTYVCKLVENGSLVRVVGLKVNVEIFQYLSRTSVTLSLQNLTDSDGTGELFFKLPPRAVISGYACDVDGHLVDATVISRDKARETFETEARKLEKPSVSIAEHVSGNLFRTKVSPMKRYLTRTLRVEYVEELSIDNENGYRYHLPLSFSRDIDLFQVQVLVDAKGIKGVSVSSDTLKAVSLEKEVTVVCGQQKTEYSSHFRDSKNAKLRKGLTVSVASSVESVIVQNGHDGAYFSIRDPLPPQVPLNSKPKVRAVGILWDASYSQKRYHSHFVKVVDALCRRHGGVSIDLILVRDTIEPSKYFQVTDGLCVPLMEYLSEIIYDGATNLSAVPALISARNNFFVLLCDGLSQTKLRFHRDRMPVPVYALYSSSSTKFNVSNLQQFARRSGGFVREITLTNICSVVGAFGVPSFSFISASFDSCHVSHVYPSVPTVCQSKVFSIGGRLSIAPGSATTFQLNYGHGSTITHRVSYELRVPGDYVSSLSLVSRFWAQLKMNQLLVLPLDDEGEKKILKLGRQFSIVTPLTSFIVLESLSQYLEHDIEPPKSLPEIRSQWKSLIDSKRSLQLASRKNKLDVVLSFWSRRVSWWSSDFNFPEISQRQFFHHFPAGKGVEESVVRESTRWDQYFHEREMILVDKTRAVEIEKRRKEAEERDRLQREEEERWEMQKKRAELREETRLLMLLARETTKERFLQFQVELFRESLKRDREAVRDREKLRMQIERKREETERSLYIKEKERNARVRKILTERRESENATLLRDLRSLLNSISSTFKTYEKKLGYFYRRKVDWEVRDAESWMENFRDCPSEWHLKRLQMLRSFKVSFLEEVSCVKNLESLHRVYKGLPVFMVYHQEESIQVAKLHELQRARQIYAESVDLTLTDEFLPPPSPFGYEGKRMVVSDFPGFPTEREEYNKDALIVSEGKISLVSRYSPSHVLHSWSLKRLKKWRQTFKGFEFNFGKGEVISLLTSVFQAPDIAEVLQKRILSMLSTRYRMFQGFRDYDGRFLYEERPERTLTVFRQNDQGWTEAQLDGHFDPSLSFRNLGILMATKEVQYGAPLLVGGAELLVNAITRPLLDRVVDGLSNLCSAAASCKYSTNRSARSVGTVDRVAQRVAQANSRLNNFIHHLASPSANLMMNELDKLFSASDLQRADRIQSIERSKKSLLREASHSGLVPPKTREFSQLSLTWAAWKQRQAKTWKEFEEVHFATEGVMFRKWRRDRVALMTRFVASSMGSIEHQLRLSKILPPLPRSRTPVVQSLISGESPRIDYGEYLSRRESELANPSFFSKCSYDLLMRGDIIHGLRVGSTLVELFFDSPQYYRYLAFCHLSFRSSRDLNAVVELQREVLLLRPEEPQSALSLALSLMLSADRLVEDLSSISIPTEDSNTRISSPVSLSPAISLYEEALSLLLHVVNGSWHARFSQIESVAITEINHLLFKLRLHFPLSAPTISNQVDSRLLSPVQSDVRVTVEWDTDGSDVELLVDDCYGESLSSFCNKSDSGGYLSRNFTGGYGPVEYFMRKAVKGTFRFSLKLISCPNKNPGTTALVRITTDYSTSFERTSMFLCPLPLDNVVVPVARVDF